MSHQNRAVKAVALYTEEENDAWKRAEEEVRQKMGPSVREGEVLARICSEFLEDKV